MSRRKDFYEIRPRRDRRGVNLISDALPFGGLWYGEPDAISNAIGYAKFYSRSHNAEIRIFDEHQQRRSAIANARARGDSFFPELPYAIPIAAGRISAQCLDALKKDPRRAIIRTKLETFAESRLSQIPLLGDVRSPSLLVAFAQAYQFFR